MQLSIVDGDLLNQDVELTGFADAVDGCAGHRQRFRPRLPGPFGRSKMRGIGGQGPL
jgi:hypothetical protein